MQTTFYDRFSSMLIALLILGGVTVALVFGLWLSAQALARPTAVPVSLVPRGDGAGLDDADETDLNVIEPGMEFEQNEPSLLDTLESVENIVSKNAAVFSDTSPMDDAMLLPGGKQGDGRTKGHGIGLAGRTRRWEFNFDQSVTVDDYAAMLDSFGIELGVLQPGGKVIYVSRLSDETPRVRAGISADENRYYTTWLKGDRENADRELLDKAGVKHQGRFVLKFLPQQLEAELEAMEKTKAGDREPKIKSSFFRVLRDGGKYKFFLYNQVF